MTAILKIDTMEYHRRVLQKWDEYKRWVIENDFQEPDVERWSHLPSLHALTFQSEADAIAFKLRWF